MKKVIMLVVLAFVLVACGKDDLTNFTDEYNRVAEKKGIDQLSFNTFEEPESESDSDRAWQLLYENDRYIIEAKYEDGKNLSGYYLVIDENQPFYDEKGEGFEAALTIIEALGLNKAKFKAEFRKALKKTSHAYDDENYIVSITNPGVDGLTSVGLIINFDKK